MPFVTVPEAATRLGIAPQTVKRRLKRGKLRGRQETTPQGFVWLVDVPDIPNYHRGGITNGIPLGISDSDAGISGGKNGIPVGTPDEILIEDSPYNEAPSISERVAILNTEVEGQRALIASLNEQVQAQKEQLSTKDRQLENKDRQIGELHVLLQQAQAALPAPKDNRSWWRFWKR
jgi:hypothetical protein